MAATNYLDGLEPTLIRDGRFDARIRLDLPSESERVEILAAQLRKFRWKNHDLTAIAKRTPGWSPARLKGLVDRASLCAQEKVIEERHLIEALESTGGRDQGSLEPVGWDDVVLPAAVVDDLRSLLDLMKPGRAEELSLPAPTGLILVGPPGTGKTLIAKLIASQAKRSFYAVSPSDVLGSAVGGSVKRLSEIFRRAKDNAPSIVFFDEMDGLFPELHGQMSQHDVQLVEQALIEISALKPEHQIFLVGTTNYLDRIDPRILRGGRFSEKVLVPVPDEAGYRKLVAKYLGKARLGQDLTVQDLAERVTGMAPADLEATIQSMKRVAMRRMDPNAKELPPLNLGDLDDALGRVQPRFCPSRQPSFRRSNSHATRFVVLGIPCMFLVCSGQRLSLIQIERYGRSSHVETFGNEPAAGGDLADGRPLSCCLLTGRGARTESRCGSTGERGCSRSDGRAARRRVSQLG